MLRRRCQGRSATPSNSDLVVTDRKLFAQLSACTSKNCAGCRCSDSRRVLKILKKFVPEKLLGLLQIAGESFICTGFEA